MSLKQKIVDRIFELSVEAPSFVLSRSLMHAYIACLTPQEVCSLVPGCFDYDEISRRAVKSRIFRIASNSISPDEIEKLAVRISITEFSDHRLRTQAEGMIAKLYPNLLAPTRQTLLDRWRDKGTKSAGARWLKAISGDESLYSVDAILQYWRQSRDNQAAKILAYRADPSMINEILDEFIEFVDEGWIVGTAARRADTVSEESLSAIAAKFPASYAYICAITNRKIPPDIALKIVYAADSQSTEHRGLAIWAIGQLGMIEVLDKIRQSSNDFYRNELIKLGIPVDHLGGADVNALFLVR